MQSTSSRKVVVVGSGIAGLASAIRLALLGMQVQVFERNAYPGGKLSWFEQDGYSFDAGPSLFTQPQNIEELFRLACERIEDYFKYERVPVSCQYFFANGKKLTAWANREKLAAEMQMQLDEDPERIQDYLRESERVYSRIGTLFLNNSLHKKGTYLSRQVLRAISATRLGYMFGTLNSHNQKHFRSAEAVQMFNRYATYNGSNPFKAPGMLSLIPHLEMNEGTFYPQGGMISITNALHQLAMKLGVEFHFCNPVERIVLNSGRATGVVVNGRQVDADVVVSNADVYFTYKHLLGDEQSSRRVLKQERSSSALIFYWGIGKSFEQLGLHNIFFSSDYATEFDHLFRSKSFFQDPTVYINITSKMEPGQAPPGKENWFVMINAPAHVGQPWPDMIAEARQRIIDKLEKMLGADVAGAIETEAVLDPPTIESRTASYMGSLYGTSSNSRFAAFFRHANFSKRTKGLYFAGGSVHPGGGIPLCLKSAKIVADTVRADLGV